MTETQFNSFLFCTIWAAALHCYSAPALMKPPPCSGSIIISKPQVNNSVFVTQVKGQDDFFFFKGACETDSVSCSKACQLGV